MKRSEEVARYLIDNPNASNLDISEELGISIGNAKRIFSDLKKAGIIEVSQTEDGRSTSVYVEKIGNKRVEKNLTRKARIEQLIEIVFETIEIETQTENVIALGHLAVKLLDRL